MIIATTKAQLVSTYATGCGSPGFAFDAVGNLFVANLASNNIIKVSPNGVNTTFYYSGLYYPTCLAFDAIGNMYIANFSGLILKVTPNGEVSPFVTVPYYPYGLAFDGAGNLFVAGYSSGNSAIYKITTNGEMSTFVSSGLYYPYGIAFDGIGNLFVANMNNNTISKVTPNGVVSTFVDSGLSYPWGLAFDAWGNLYVANSVSPSGNFTISKVSSAGVVTTFINSGLSKPQGLAFDNIGNLYVSNDKNNSIDKIIFGTVPLSFVSFAIQVDNVNVTLNWQTATELNSKQFFIQHSTNGISYTDIGTVKAISNATNSYEYKDNKPANGINYYRLQSVDKDGSSSYSKVVSVNIGDKQSFSIAPNPTKDFASISFSKAVEKATIAVYDISGKIVITKLISGNTNAYKLNTQSLKSGVYVIKVNTNTGSYNEKLLINK